MVQSYEKNQKERRKGLEKLLMKQKKRRVGQIDAYKLSVCHPHSTGIGLGSTENYVALHPSMD